MGLASRLFIRTALLSFVAGTVMGAGMLLTYALTGQAAPRVWVVVHVHVLGVGWLTNMVLGVAYWMFPRTSGAFTLRTEAALVTYVLLNGGLLLRLICEPLALATGMPGAFGGLAISAVLQGAAAIWFGVTMWGRVPGLRKR